MKTLILILCMTFSGCAMRAPVATPATQAEHYAYRQLGQTYYVVVDDDEALQEALKAIGCGVCLPEKMGIAYQVEKVSK
jgi:hypothetical protein